MKRHSIFVWILTAFLVLGLSGCHNGIASTEEGQKGTVTKQIDLQEESESFSEATQENFVLPPVRVSPDAQAEGRLYRAYTFQEGFEEAEIVAVIKIGNWLSETETHCGTFFEATPLMVYKGELSESFIFYQAGYSEATLMHWPLYSYGEEVLVFLKSTKGMKVEDTYGYKDFVYSIAAYATSFYIVQDDAGCSYIVDWIGEIGRSVPDAKNYAEDGRITGQLRKNLEILDDVCGKRLSYDHYNDTYTVENCSFDNGHSAIITVEEFERATKKLREGQ